MIFDAEFSVKGVNAFDCFPLSPRKGKVAPSA